jgi:hypothetical protein
VGQREMAITARTEVKNTWQLVEHHGVWWAYEGELPPPDAFQTHSRPRQPMILGPYPSRVVAEALLRRHRRTEGRRQKIA